MRENEWTNTIKNLLNDAGLEDNIDFDTLNKVPYAREIQDALHCPADCSDTALTSIL